VSRRGVSAGPVVIAVDPHKRSWTAVAVNGSLQMTLLACCVGFGRGMSRGHPAAAGGGVGCRGPPTRRSDRRDR
jgi:hypothetical protein